MAIFPSYAWVLKDNYDETPSYGVLRTDMDGGLSKQRPTRSIPVVTRTVNVYVGSLADKISFDTWFRNDLNGGTGWFDWVDVDGVTKNTRIVGGTFKWQQQGLAWVGQCQFETVG